MVRITGLSGRSAFASAMRAVPTACARVANWVFAAGAVFGSNRRSDSNGLRNANGSFEPLDAQPARPTTTNARQRMELRMKLSSGRNPHIARPGVGSKGTCNVYNAGIEPLTSQRAVGVAILMVVL